MRGGCDFPQTKMERHWLVLLVTPWWMLHR